MEKSSRLADGKDISEEAAEQYRYNMLAEVASLPNQDQIELTDDALDTNFWPEMNAAGFYTGSHHVNMKTCPTLRDYLDALKNPKSSMATVPDVEIYYFVSLRFGFRPTVSPNANLLGTAMQRDEAYSDKGLDVSFIDDLVGEHFGKKLDFSAIGLRKPTIEKFGEAGIVTVGDFIMKAPVEKMHKRYGMSIAPLRRVAEFIEREYGLNRTKLKTHVPLRETLKIRYAVMLAAQDETE